MSLHNVTGRIVFEFGLDRDGELVWSVENQDVSAEQAYPTLRLYAKHLERRLLDEIEDAEDDAEDA